MLRPYEWTHTNAPNGYALANVPYECGPTVAALKFAHNNAHHGNGPDIAP